MNKYIKFRQTTKCLFKQTDNLNTDKRLITLKISNAIASDLTRDFSKMSARLENILVHNFSKGAR